MRSLVVLCAVIALCGCGSTDPAPVAVSVRALQLPPHVEARDRDLDPAPTVLVIRDATTYADVVRSLNWDPEVRRSGAEAVDFRKDHVVLISWGAKPGLDYRLRARAITADAESVMIALDTIAPDVLLRLDEVEFDAWPYLALVVPARPRVEVTLAGDRIPAAPVEPDGSPPDVGSLDFLESHVTTVVGPGERAPAAGKAFAVRAYRIRLPHVAWPQVQVYRTTASFERLLNVWGEEAEVEELGEESGASWPWTQSPFAEVDFRTHQVVTVSFGRKPNLGYGITLRGARRVNDAVVLEVETSIPGPDELSAEAEGCPSLSVIVPQAPRVEVVVLGERIADHANEFYRELPDFSSGELVVRFAR